jgi:uncharacterized protein (TIGR02996 family)
MGMSDGDAFLTAIAGQPDDDTVRLVFADFLEEHGEPVRAEFIRTQVQISRLETLPRAELDRHVAVFERNQELIDRHRAELLGPLAAVPAECVEFRRGFVSRLDVPVSLFLTHAERIAGLRPLPAVRVREVAGNLPGFLRCRELGVVTELSAYAPQIPAVPDNDILGGVERLTRLSVLDL